LNSKKLLIIDRDGTLIRHIPYLGDPKLVELERDAGEVLFQLSKIGFIFAIATNQSAINRGLITKNNVLEINAKIIDLLLDFKVSIDVIEFCPHIESDNCECRKPKIEMGLRILSKLNIDKSNAFMVGDNSTDMEFALNLGITPIPFENHNNSIKSYDFICRNWLQVLDKIRELI